MYSVVLLAAMTAAESAPDFRHKGYPASYGACYGACYGVGYCGWGCSGGWGQPYSGYCGHGGYQQPHWPGYACYGGCGGYQSPAYGFAVPPVDTTPPATAAPSTNGTKKEDTKQPETEKKSPTLEKKGKEIPKIGEDKDGTQQPMASAGRARVIINLPAGAKLFVDDQPIAAASAKKEFRTPPLNKGEQYYYDLRAELIRDGQTIRKSKRILISAGQVIEADFSTLGTETGVATASK